MGLSVVNVVFFGTKTFLIFGFGLAGIFGASEAGSGPFAVLSRWYIVFSGSLGWSDILYSEKSF